MATIETVDRSVPRGVPGPVQRKVRVQIRRVNPWSVLKFSLIFYFCLMLVVLLGAGILFAMLDAAGIIDSLEDLLTAVWTPGNGDIATGPNDVVTPFQISFPYLMRTLFLIGVLSTILWAALTVFMAFLYNLIADLVGGIEVTLTERR